MPLEGQHLGHYRLLRLLGSGGMGEVYLAEDARIGQQVAIKVIRSEGIAYPGSESAKEAARLFEREASHRPPFQGNPGQVMRQHYLTPPPAPSTLNPRLSPIIDTVLLHALAKQLDERFPSISDFARTFQQTAQSSGELHATLAISRAEATTGTTRSLTLPGGQQVSVTVPAGVRDASILRLEGQGMPSYAGGPAGSLVLTMSIAADSPSPLSQASTEPTLAVSMYTELSPPTQVARSSIPVLATCAVSRTMRSPIESART